MRHIIYFAILALSVTSCYASPHSSRLDERDREYMWAVSSGPNGERDAKAVPLYTAIISQNHANVKELLESGSSPNLLLSRDRWSPLMIAAAEGDLELTRLLVGKGANLNFTRCYAISFSPLSVALEFAIPKQDFAVFDYLLTAGADVNATCVDNGDSIERDGLGNAFTGHDIAKSAATLGQMNVVNRLLSLGYRRDIPGLLVVLKIRVVDEATQAKKDRAIATVVSILADPSYRSALPSLLEDLRQIIANGGVDPKKDPEILRLERILKG